MKGLDLAESYYREIGSPMIAAKFPEHKKRIAAGLVGPGSECFGFDDELSRDHDWGPGFCLWLTEQDRPAIGPTLQEAYDRLPTRFRGLGPRVASLGEEGRVGVCGVVPFFRTYTGLERPPQSLREWLAIPEASLAVCTNGRVFDDPAGVFSAWRETLKGFYPRDVWLKKIASRCATVAQAGQYNFERSLRRGERFAAHYALTQFCADAMSLVFLLNRRYAPFYKWMHRAVRDLPLLGARIHAMVAELTEERDDGARVPMIEEMCGLLIEELRREQLSDSRSDFLLEHAHSVHGRIEDPELGARFFVVS
ncbi:MAG: DUF4037 domain-containing protein [Spirochaetales bacterium]|nr:DUF4037 domain-containing protein [Spirochaetales bacterium]